MNRKVHKIKFKHTLKVLWPLYFLVNYTIARSIDVNLQLFIWGALVPPLLGTIYAISKIGLKAIIEVKLFIVLIVWALLSAVAADNFDAQYLRYLFQFTIILYLVSEMIVYTRSVKAFFWSFWLVGVYSTIDLLVNVNWGLAHLIFSSGRQMGIFTSENLLGIYGSIGVLGGLSLLGFKNNYLAKNITLLGILTSLISVVVSGSRGGILMVLFYLLWWTFVIMRTKIKSKFKWFLLIICLLYGAYKGYQKFVTGTILNERISTTNVGLGGEGETRMLLMEKGYMLGLQNPILGVSFGGFRKHAGTGHDYAHNDFADFIASLGLIGWILYLLVHLLLVRRLRLSLKRERDEQSRYILHLGLMIIIGLILSAAVFRPNFTALDVWITFGLSLGISRLTSYRAT